MGTSTMMDDHHETHCDEVICVPENSLLLAFYIMASLVVFTFLFELASKHIEHACKRWAVSQTMIEHLYKELSILGLISFMFFLLSHFGDLKDRVSHDDLVVFENAHVLMFLTAVYYLVTVGAVLAGSAWWARWYRRTDGEPISESALQEAFQERSACQMFCSPTILTEKAFFMLKRDFLNKNDMHDSEAFDFPKYLRRCMQTDAAVLVELGSSSWFVILILIGVAALLHSFSNGVALVTFLASAPLLTLTVALLALFKAISVLRLILARVDIRDVVESERLDPGDVRWSELEARRTRSGHADVRMSTRIDALAATMAEERTHAHDVAPTGEPLVDVSAHDRNGRTLFRILTCRAEAPRTEQERMFWLSSPDFLLNALRTVLLTQAIIMASATLFVANSLYGVLIVLWVVLGLTAIATAGVCTMLLAPLLSLIRCVHQFHHVEDVEYVLRRTIRKRLMTLYAVRTEMRQEASLARSQATMRHAQASPRPDVAAQMADDEYIHEVPMRPLHVANPSYMA
jgi:hypothetical protein